MSLPSRPCGACVGGAGQSGLLRQERARRGCAAGRRAGTRPSARCTRSTAAAAAPAVPAALAWPLVQAPGRGAAPRGGGSSSGARHRRPHLGHLSPWSVFIVVSSPPPACWPHRRPLALWLLAALWLLRLARAALPQRPLLQPLRDTCLPSLAAGVSYVDDALHAAIYEQQEGGLAVTPAQVLAGLVDPPLEFRPLYQALHDLAGTAQVGCSRGLLARSAARGVQLTGSLPACWPAGCPPAPCGAPPPAASCLFPALPCPTSAAADAAHPEPV